MLLSYGFHNFVDIPDVFGHHIIPHSVSGQNTRTDRFTDRPVFRMIPECVGKNVQPIVLTAANNIHNRLAPVAAAVGQILKVVKEGIKVFVQAGKILFGKQASQMTAAQKGDAIIKILGGSVIAICGIGIEALLNKIGVTEPWSVILSTMLSGIASTMFMFLLDKIDIRKDFQKSR